jgi:hypothetical protein
MGDNLMKKRKKRIIVDPRIRKNGKPFAWQTDAVLYQDKPNFPYDKFAEQNKIKYD